MPELPAIIGLTMLPSRDAHMDVVQATANGSWSFADAAYDGSVVLELQSAVQKYPKWNILPIDECERLQLVNSSLWALLNVHSNATTGGPILCLDHAPQLDLSSTIQAIILGILFLFSLVGNLLTVYSISQKQTSSSRQYQSSVYNLIFHLSIADLLVTVTCLFGEAIWSYYVSWLADNFTCKLFKFLQVFSLYLSTFVLVLIGLDRFLAVKYPMKSLSTKRRCNRLIAAVWVLSLFLSSPQFLIFRVGKGPFYEDFYQCVTYGFYTELWQEQVYNISSLFLMFILPLMIIIWSYVSTFITLARPFLRLNEYKKTQLPFACGVVYHTDLEPTMVETFSNQQISEPVAFAMVQTSKKGSEKMFRAEVESGNFLPSDVNRRRLMHRAKTKSMRISVVIVVAFIICWTPYYFMMIVFMFWEPGEQLERNLRSGIFCFGMSNSLINPLIYGAFHLWRPKHQRRPTCSSRDFNQFSLRSTSARRKTIRNGPKTEAHFMTAVHEEECSIMSCQDEKPQATKLKNTRLAAKILLRYKGVFSPQSQIHL